MEALPGLWQLSPIGFGIGVVALVYWLLLTGRLIPRASHEREMNQSNKRGDEWKDTALTERAAREKTSGQLDLALDANRAWEAVFRSAGVTIDENTIPGGGGR